VAVFIMTMVRPEIRNYLAVTKPIFGHYWTVFTAMFVHAGIEHIVLNMLTLYFFGVLCLQLVELKWFLLVYFVGGVVGNLLFLLIGPMYSAAVGASGAIFALGGVLAVMRPRIRVYLYFLIPTPLWLGIIIGFLLTAFTAGVAWQAHLGGLVVGIIVGFFLRRRGREYLNAAPGHYRYR
jgi:membrane associated rhomboid family serine protease